jgi:hypothetical protein
VIGAELLADQGFARRDQETHVLNRRDLQKTLGLLFTGQQNVHLPPQVTVRTRVSVEKCLPSLRRVLQSFVEERLDLGPKLGIHVPLRSERTTPRTWPGQRACCCGRTLSFVDTTVTLAR